MGFITRFAHEPHMPKIAHDVKATEAKPSDIPALGKLNRAADLLEIVATAANRGPTVDPGEERL